MSKVASFLPDLLLVAGYVSLSYGAYLAHPAAGFLVSGALLIFAGVLLARAPAARKT